MTNNCSAEFARDTFSYDPDTGEVFRRSTGKLAGWLNKNGYRYVSVHNRKILVHRLAWLMHYGHWPNLTIDHINRNPLDNRIANLRDVDMTTQGHNHNLHRDNTSGHKNVYFHRPSGLWVVLVFHRHKQTCVGYFRDKDMAVAARDIAKAKLLAA